MQASGLSDHGMYNTTAIKCEKVFARPSLFASIPRPGQGPSYRSQKRSASKRPRQMIALDSTGATVLLVMPPIWFCASSKMCVPAEGQRVAIDSQADDLSCEPSDGRACERRFPDRDSNLW